MRYSTTKFLFSLAVTWLLVGPSEAALPQCLQEAQWTSNPLDRTKLGGAQVAVRTSRGNYALLIVNSSDTLLIGELMVFDPAGKRLLRKRGMRIRPSFLFDADTGLERPTGADLWWHGIAPGTSRLEPKNGAQVHLCRLIRGRTREEWVRRWAFLADESETAARQGNCDFGWAQRRCVPEYCEKDQHCQFGHYWGNNNWDQETKGRCIFNECLESSNYSANPNDRGCERNYDCDNKNYKGSCDDRGLCDSRERSSCELPGSIEPCITDDGRIGKAQCREWKRLGTCVALEYQREPPP